jgi:exodeoxyribonuclease VII small subunit
MKSFEEKLERLEEISSAMRAQGTPLADSLSLFEEGIQLAGELEKELKAAEQRVEILTNSITEQTEPETEPFSGA